MAKKLFVGGLSYQTNEETLKETFAQAGTVESATVIVDKMSGRSKGFGFVEMSSEEEAAKAIEMFNGKEIDGKSVTVNEARPMEARPKRGGFGGGDRGFGGNRRERW
ncbi:MAG: RNA-binding protein [Candidatus Nealsonbacteria bacterium]|nr:RNA-binding protein [Candidatus Nealsonbacteria bacterium]